MCRLFVLSLNLLWKYNFLKIYVTTTKPRTPERPQQEEMLTESTTRSSNFLSESCSYCTEPQKKGIIIHYRHFET